MNELNEHPTLFHSLFESKTIISLFAFFFLPCAFLVQFHPVKSYHTCQLNYGEHQFHGASCLKLICSVASDRHRSLEFPVCIHQIAFF